MSFDKYRGYIGLAVALTIIVTAGIILSYRNYREKFPEKNDKNVVEAATTTTQKTKTGMKAGESTTRDNKIVTGLEQDLEKYAQEFAAAKKFEEEKNPVEARRIYEKLLPVLNRPDIAQKEIYRLNIAILFSPKITEPPDGPKSEIYTVKAGDTIEGIAKKYNTTTDLVMASNGIKDPRTIQIGNRYKIVTDEFSIIVNKSKNILTLLAGNIVMKEYPVGTGEYDKTPVGDFKIRNKIPEPPWKGIPYGDPRNVLGTRWMGLVNEGDTIPGYGIHGTWEPETIGKNVSQGCIRMLNEDVEELFKIVPVGTKVKIIE